MSERTRRGNAKANEENPAFQFKQPIRLGASSSKPPLPSYGIGNPRSKQSNLGPPEKSFNDDV